MKSISTYPARFWGSLSRPWRTGLQWGLVAGGLYFLLRKGTPPKVPGVAYGKLVSPAFLAAVVEMAKRLKTDPSYLMTTMFAESGFNPQAINPKSGASGLIQFMPKTALGLGTTIEALRQMSAFEQLPWVEKYFAPYKGKLTSMENVRLVNYFPAAVGHPKGLNYVLFSRDGYSDYRKHKDPKKNAEWSRKAYEQNAGSDRNGDGRVDAREVTQHAVKLYQLGMSDKNRSE